MPWRVPVALEAVAEDGEHFDMAADGDTRAAVARMAGLRELPRFEAHFDVRRYGSGGLRVIGRVSATVGQNCVVTLEPLVNEIEEEVDLSFAPQQVAEPEAADADAGAEQAAGLSEKSWSGPEPLIGGVVDLGAVATEFLILGLDPYPRKPGAVFEPPRDGKPEDGPFAILAQLTKRPNGG